MGNIFWNATKLYSIYCIFLPNIGIQMAFSYKLISSQVGIVWRGDEVTSERLVHVLVHWCVGLVEYAALFGLHVPEESFKCHGPAFSGLKKKKQRNTLSVTVIISFLSVALPTAKKSNTIGSLSKRTVRSVGSLTKSNLINNNIRHSDALRWM